MGKSIKEYLTAFGKWGLLIAAFLVGDLLGIYQSYKTDFVLPQWGWWLILAAILIASPLIAFHKIRIKRDQLQQVLNDIQDERPKVETRVRKQLDEFDIEVFNSGAEAEFEAQVEIFSGKRYLVGLPQNYYAYWEKTKNNKTELKNGQRDYIKVASLSINTPSATTKYILHYYENVYFNGSANPRIANANSTSWIPGNTSVISPMISLKIAISSKPSMINGATISYYMLSDGDFSESNLE